MTTTTSTATLPTRTAALAFMSNQELTNHGARGYVVIFNGEGCAWTSEKPRCSDFRPGCVAVEVETGAQFQAVGGSYGAGCERWEQVSQSS